jgi:hypothetical protein
MSPVCRSCSGNAILDGVCQFCGERVLDEAVTNGSPMPRRLSVAERSEVVAILRAIPYADDDHTYMRACELADEMEAEPVSREAELAVALWDLTDRLEANRRALPEDVQAQVLSTGGVPEALDRAQALLKGAERTHTPSGLTEPTGKQVGWALHAWQEYHDLAESERRRISVEKFGHTGAHVSSVAPSLDAAMRCALRAALEAEPSEGHTLVPNEHLDRFAQAWKNEDTALCEAYMKAFREAQRPGGRPQWPGTEGASS